MLAPVVMGGVLVACSTSEGSTTAPSSIGSELAFPSTDTVAGPAVDPAAWTDKAPGGPTLGPTPTAAEIRQVVEDAHGRTTDVSAEMLRFAPFPAVLTPERASVVELRADVRDLNDDAEILVTSEVLFSADGRAEDLVTRYTDDFTERGWLLVESREASSDGVPARELEFNIPGSGFGRNDLAVTVLPDEPLDGVERSLIRIRYLTLQPPGDELATRFLAWPGGLPLPEGPLVIGGGIHTSAVGRNTLHFTLAMLYDELTADEVAQAVRAGLPAGGYRERPTPLSGDATDDWVHLSSDVFDRSWVSTQGAGIGPATRVNVDANVGFEPGA